MKYSKDIKNYARSFMVELLNYQDPASQLNIAKAHFEKFLKDFLTEMRGSKYQITLQITFRKEIENYETTYPPPICFRSNTQTVINDLILITIVRLSK